MTARAIPHAMTTTALTIDGYRSTKSLGVVRSVPVRSRSIVMGGVTEVLCYGTAVAMAPA
jgi:uncharacterized protein YbjQ (UPF0145 family)